MPTSHRPNPAERMWSSANAWVSARCEAALAGLVWTWFSSRISRRSLAISSIADEIVEQRLVEGVEVVFPPGVEPGTEEAPTDYPRVVWKESFGVFDLLWLAFALGTAFEIGVDEPST